MCGSQRDVGREGSLGFSSWTFLATTPIVPINTDQFLFHVDTEYHQWGSTRQ